MRLRERFERYWSLSPEEKARKMARDLQVVRLMEATHPGHPALAHGHEAGRSIERGGFYRKVPMHSPAACMDWHACSILIRGSHVIVLIDNDKMPDSLAKADDTS